MSALTQHSILQSVEKESLQYFSLRDDFTAHDNILLVVEKCDYFDNVELDSEVCKKAGIATPADLALVRAAASRMSPPGTDKGSSIEFLVSSSVEGEFRRFSISCLPTAISRTNTPSRSHSVSALVKSNRGSGNVSVFLLPLDPENAFAQGCAAARQFPRYSDKFGFKKSIAEKKISSVQIIIDLGEENNLDHLKDLESVGESIRLAQELVDLPPNKLNCTTYVEICEQVVKDLPGCTIKIIAGKDLDEQGFGGLYGVGKASEHPPALAILSHVPAGKENEKSICMVGKGIVYDTGGLSIKVPPNMAGMKTDMGGSAAVLGSFQSIVRRGGLNCPCHALLCIAENSVDERAARPDDVHIMLSGKSVEINNTDAEGRLVLGDGVFYAYRDLNPAYIMDIATLTGAQLVTTGRRHAALYCNDPTLEDAAQVCGKRTGDLTYPMLYCPEFHRAMFASSVADMKNSVSDRMNAQCSCAGQFIGNHLTEYLEEGGNWLHIDMAGPANDGDRATGFGVALLFDIARWCSSK